MSILHKIRESLRARQDRRPVLATLGMVAVALLASVSLFATGPAPEPLPRAERAWPVSAVTVTPGPMRPTLTGFGRVESTRIATLGTDLTLTVRRVHRYEGDWAETGELLIELDDAELELELRQREAELEQAGALLDALHAERGMLIDTLTQIRSMHALSTAKLERHEALRARGLISQSVLDEVQAQTDQVTMDRQTHEYRLAELPHRLRAQQALLERAEAVTALTRLELERTRILAPFAGPVLALHVAEGDRSRAGAPLLQIAAADSYELRVQIPAGDGPRFRARLHTGDSITATVPGSGPMPLVRVAGQVKPGQSGVDAFFALASGPAGLLAALGQTIEVAIELPEEPDVVALPVSALYENNRIYAVEFDRLTPIEVERVGDTRKGGGATQVLVRSPELAGRRQVITSQLPRATPGLLVQPST